MTPREWASYIEVCEGEPATVRSVTYGRREPTGWISQNGCAKTVHLHAQAAGRTQLPLRQAAGNVPAMKNVPPRIKVSAGSAGFTILELMIAVAVVGILVGIGVPSFNNIIRQNRLAGHTNELLSAAAIARSEAVKRGAMVSMCAAAGNICATVDNRWSDGWIVFADDGGATVGTIDGTDTVIQRWPAASAQITITGSANALRFLTYRSDGATTLPLGTQATFTVTPVGCVSEPDGQRQVAVAANGRAGSTRRNCP